MVKHFTTTFFIVESKEGKKNLKKVLVDLMVQFVWL